MESDRADRDESAHAPRFPNVVSTPSADPDDERMRQLTTAIAGAQHFANLADALRIQTVLGAFDAMVLQEQEDGSGVPMGGVAERAFVMHLGVLLQMSRQSAKLLLYDALALRATLPQTWAAFGEGGFSWRAARIVADLAEGLEPQERSRFDAEAAALAPDMPPHELDRRLTRLRDRLDPEAAASRAARAMRGRHVAVAPTRDGQGTMGLNGPATDIAAMEDGIRQAAVEAHGREGETRSVGALMFDIAADLILHGLARPGSVFTDPGTPAERIGDVRVPDRKAVTPTIFVTIPAETAVGAGNEPATVAGFGAIDAREATRLVAHTRTWTRVVVDPVDQAILRFDSHERYIPAALRRYLALRDDTCTGPGCGRAAHRCDLDHMVRFEHFGPTNPANLTSLCRPEHQIKDEGYWCIERLDDGAIKWVSRWGSVRIVRPNHPTAPVPEIVDEEPPPF